ncbi:MAG: DUF1460 domain-containing protein [Muribaculaceae bacterium]
MKQPIKKYIGKSVACLAFAASLLIGSATCGAYETRIHCSEDTLKIGQLLKPLAESTASLGDRIVMAAHMLEGVPLGQPSDNDSVGTIVVNLHEFDRMGFANTVLALAETSRQKLPVVKEYERQYESYSRRKGEDDGFASQLIYVSDWIVDNVYRGHLKDMTEYLGGGGFKTKTLDHLTRHRDDYPAMKNSDTYDKVRMMEMGYRSHRIPHMKKQSASNKPFHELLRNGDIIVMLSNEIDFDLYDIGFVEMKDGEPYLIHISHTDGKVVADPFPLSRLFKIEGQHFYGYRWLRPQE